MEGFRSEAEFEAYELRRAENEAIEESAAEYARLEEAAREREALEPGVKPLPEGVSARCTMFSCPRPAALTVTVAMGGQHRTRDPLYDAGPLPPIEFREMALCQPCFDAMFAESEHVSAAQGETS